MVDTIEQHSDHTVGQRQRSLDGLDEPGANLRAHADAVGDQLDGVLLIPGEADVVLQGAQLAVDAGTEEAAGQRLCQLLAVLTLPINDHRRHHDQALPEREPGEVIGDLARSERLNGLQADRAARGAEACEEQPEVIEDLGDRADRGARVAVDGLLIDAEGRGEPVDPLDLRASHLAEKLPGVGGQRLHEPPLAFLVDRVERQAALSAARQPGDDHERVSRELYGDPLEVVLSRTDDLDVICCHVALLTG